MGRGGEGAIAPTPKRRIFELLCHASDSLSLFLPLPLSPPPPSFELFVENETALPLPLSPSPPLPLFLPLGQIKFC